MLKLCTICHHIGEPRDAGSWANYFIFGFFIGLFINDMYTNLCPQCENRNCMIPIDSTRAQNISKEYELELPYTDEEDDDEIKPPRMPWQYR